jgi:hypothetical protein
MKLADIYALAISMGIEKDPRGRAEVDKVLTKAQKAYDKLEEKEKQFFDWESLSNPYADSRILVGDPQAEIKKLIVGIDMELPELLLTASLNAAGAEIDLVMGHHPEGRALAALDQVMHLQPGAWANAGVTRSVAESLLEGRAKEVKISTGGSNYNRSVDAARLLGIPLICLHTPCDNQVNTFLTQLLTEQSPDTVADVIDILLDIPEYMAAAKDNNAPMIVSGSRSRSAGKIFVDMTGGTGGPKEYYRLLAEAGISTVLSMHAGKETIEQAKDCHLNLVIAGHMASDSLGINFILDALEQKGVEIVPASGMIRISRN